MKVLIAMDEFEEVLSSYDANRFVEEAVKSQLPDSDIVQVPLFNGQREVIDSILLWQSGMKYSVKHYDAYMHPKTSTYAITEKGQVVVEASKVLTQQKDDINPMDTTSYGLGEMLKEILKGKVQSLIISLGDISSYDGGLGMLQALGAQYFDAENQIVDLKKGVKMVKYIRRIDFSKLDQRLKDCDVQLITDYPSKYYGKNSRIMKEYQQKNISFDDAKNIDNALWYINELMKSQYQYLLGKEERGGAGSGIAAIMKNIWNAKLVTGGYLVNEITYLDQLIEQADLVIFGEGLKESQHLLETTSLRTAELANKYNKVSIAICATDSKFDYYTNQNVTAMFKILNKNQDNLNDIETGIALRHLTIQALNLLNTRVQY